MSDEELAKDLGLLSALTIGIGTMIGAGIFVLPGVAAQEVGPAVVISFVLGGMIALINAMSVSELGTAMPKAGGAYYYINRALGPLFGSISGMGDWIGLAFASAFYCIGFGGYLADLLEGVTISLPLLGSVALLPTIGLGPFTLGGIQIGAIIAGVLFVGINYIGAKETGSIQTVIVTLLLGILTIFAIIGFFSFEWSTVMTDGTLTPMGTFEILPGAALVFVSYLGYAKIATIGEELKNPGRNLPIAIIGSVAIVMVIYAILVGLLMGLIPYDVLDPDAPMSEAAGVVFDIQFAVAGVDISLLGAGVTSITLAALLATASSANASILASARINFAMGRDKIVSDSLNEIHPKYATPYRSIAVTGVMILVFIVLLGETVEILSSAASVLHLVVYALINVSLIVFREADAPEYDPVFTVPFYPFTPILGFVFSLALIYFMDPVASAIGLLFVVFAVVWYFVYARHKTDREGLLSNYILERSEEMPDSAVSAASAVKPQGEDEPQVMVAIANPRTERALLTLGSALAREKGGSVLATHIVQVPDQTPLQQGADHLDRVSSESERLLADAKESTETFDVDVETKTIISHRSLDEVFDAGRADNVEAIVMGSGGSMLESGRVERPLEELTNDLPADVVVLNGEEVVPDRLLVPTAGGEESELSGEIARALREEYGSDITLLHVADSPDEREEGEAFISEWATENGLEDATLRVDDSGDVGSAIEREATDHSMVLIGATRRGLLSRYVRGSEVSDIVDRLDVPVLLTEKRSSRTLREQLFGRREE